MSKLITTGYGYEGKPGNRHRVFAHHQGKLLPMLWFSMGKDGSLYIGPYVPNADAVKIGTLTSDQNDVLNVSYEDGTAFSKSDTRATKASFHTSGVIHLADYRAFRKPIDQESSTFDLCFMAFAAPDKRNYKAKREIRKWDIVSEFHISDKHPVFCKVRYSVGTTHLLEDAGTIEWKTLVRFADLDRIGTANIDITLLSASEGPWPPYSYLLTAATLD
ncbi:MAG: hypothetical protein ABJJ37_27025 [Roseibium sp.]